MESTDPDEEEEEPKSVTPPPSVTPPVPSRVEEVPKSSETTSETTSKPPPSSKSGGKLFLSFQLDSTCLAGQCVHWSKFVINYQDLYHVHCTHGKSGDR